MNGGYRQIEEEDIQLMFKKILVYLCTRSFGNTLLELVKISW